MERLLRVNGVDLCVETFGDPTDAAILLIAGMSCSMDWWEDGLCERLASGQRHVVRYDFRDTGRSTTYPPGEPGYTGADLRADAVALLDALGVASAHLVGMSMGGAVAQGIAVEHPGLVTTLTLVSTTPALEGAPSGLPPMTPEMAESLRALGRRPAPDWADGPAVVDRLVAEQRAFMRAGFEEGRVRAVARRVVARSADLASMGNHALLEPGPDPHGTLLDLAAPTLVVHGTADPLFPLGHGRALARAVRHGSLLALAGVGHEPPPPSTWDVVVPAVLQHTSPRAVSRRPRRSRAPR
ncbi:alpha/beta fold hydrolase [Nocardioides dongkuii]|uniref:alpha/beta fold hydrolase n=1 Tax=Nocardioides dongkuii TaxID=2760089 RepID=UPI0015F8ECA7|nr:alpha/beta hydrolase [Nocardioides dongkuii]